MSRITRNVVIALAVLVVLSVLAFAVVWIGGISESDSNEFYYKGDRRPETPGRLR
jgi:hypothetical protein